MSLPGNIDQQDAYCGLPYGDDLGLQGNGTDH